LALAPEAGVEVAIEIRGGPIEPFVLAAVLVASSLRGAKLAAVVMLHNAADLFFWRILRIGLAGKRDYAAELVGDRKVRVIDVREHGVEAAMDVKIDEWWEDIERKSLPQKWDAAVRMFGHPPNLIEKTWYFDKKVLCEFDELRHGVVHSSGEDLLKYSVREFSGQLSRAIMAWLVQVAQDLTIYMPGELIVKTKPRPAKA